MNKILIAIAALVLSLSVTAQQKMILVVDAGHGGKDPGALAANGQKESDVCLDMAYVLADYAKQQGITVVMTRKKKDQFLTHQKRSGFKRNPDVPTYFVSLHLDKDKDANKRGVKIYYYSLSKYATASKVLAEKLGKGLEHLNNTSSKVEDKDAVVLKKNEMASVMVYFGYMTNPSDLKRAKDLAYQKQLAALIIRSVSETKY